MSQALRKENQVILPLPQDGPAEKTVRRKKVFSLSKSKLPLLAVILLLSYLAVLCGSQFGKLSVMKQDVQVIQQQVQELKVKNSALQEELRAVQSNDFIEKTAREELGLIMPGETRVVPVPPGTELETIEAPSQENMAPH
jgi:cell division protein FtsB